MSVELVYLEDIIEQFGISLPEFSVCEGVNGLLKMLRPQFKAELKYNNITGPYIESSEMDELCLNTLSIAKSENVDLLLTPEYAFSYDVIDRIVYDENDEYQPERGKLWCICCQGISVDQYIEKFNQYSEVCHVIDASIKAMDKKEFVNSLIYIFKDVNNKLVLVPQVKTYYMADGYLYCEGSGLSLGKIIYKIGKGQCNQICTIICADAFQYQLQGIDLNALKTFSESMIFLHPQLNAKPRHDSFSALRKMAYGLVEYRDFVYITANWADGTRLVNDRPELGVSDLVIRNPWSSIYIKDINNKWFDKEKSLRNENHLKGLGFGYLEQKKLKIWYSFKDELLHKILLRKPRCVGPEETAIRKEIVASKVFRNDDSKWTEYDSLTCIDNLPDVIDVELENQKYNFPLRATKEVRDLFFGISLGTYEMGQLLVDDKEKHCNVGTFIDYECEDVREESAVNFRSLVAILQNEELPSSMKELIKDHEFAIVDDVFNLKSSGDFRAKVAFVPKVSDARKLYEAYEKEINKKYKPELNGFSEEEVELYRTEYQEFEKSKICILTFDKSGIKVTSFPKINENITNPNRKQDETSILR